MRGPSLVLVNGAQGAGEQEREIDRAVRHLDALCSPLEPGDPETVQAAFIAAVEKARSLCGGAEDSNRSLVALLHARGLVQLRRDAEAESVLRAAISTTAGDSRPRAFLHLDLAEACGARRDSAAVLDLTARAEAMCKSVPGLADEPEFQLALLLPRCQAWIDLGRQDRMADLVVRLEKLAPSLDPELRRDVALQRSNVLLALRAWEPLESAAREALADPGIPAALRASWTLRRALALSEIARLEPARAAEAHRELQAVVDMDVLEPHEHDAALLTLADLEVRARDPAAAASRLREFSARQGAAGALDVEQRATFESLDIEVAFATRAARGELEALRERARSALDSLREDWALRPVVPGGQGFLLFGAPLFLLGQYTRLEITLEGESTGVERAFAALARLQSAGTVARTLELGEVDAARLRTELLAEDASLVAILPNSLRTHVLVLGPHGAVAAEAAPLEQLEVLRGEFTSMLLTAPIQGRPERTVRMRASSGALRDALLDGRVIAELRSRPVVIVVGADLMGGLPIEALELGDDRAIGLECGIAHAPSLPLAVALAARSRAPVPEGPWDVVVFGAPEHSPSVLEHWPAIVSVPLDAADLRELGGAYPPDRVRVLAGRDATLAALQAPGLATARLLHIVTHGVFDAARDEPAGLVVSRGEGGSDVAWYADLRALTAARVVALWACGTQRGPSRLGDDTASHLGSAFLEAKACTVLLSRADVALGPGLLMARRVSREIERLESPVEALRAARAEVASDRATSDPFFYANVVLYGDPGRRDLARQRTTGVGLEAPKSLVPNWSAAAIIASALIAAALLVWRLVRRDSTRRA